MSEAEATNPWVEEVKQEVARQAYSLNYDDGIQCRVLPLRKEGDWHVWEIKLETTHSGYPFDLDWFVRWTDQPSDGVDFELVGTAVQGGTLWHERFVGSQRFAMAAQVLPVFLRGYFVGRESASAQAAAEAAAEGRDG